MSRRSAPPQRTKACGEHKAYRTEYEAQNAGAWHLGMPCGRCRSGFIWHVWAHDRHWHIGHASVRALSA